MFFTTNLVLNNKKEKNSLRARNKHFPILKDTMELGKLPGSQMCYVGSVHQHRRNLPKIYSPPRSSILECRSPPRPSIPERYSSPRSSTLDRVLTTKVVNVSTFLDQDCSSSSAFYWHSKDKIVALHTVPWVSRGGGLRVRAVYNRREVCECDG